ncbi:hypothetical protein TIFTF001_033696 [Ficus carica]|uniref:Uncharacterized protein n=1 Tax=Ficus carica TaxID=3494 RepID=A0AA88E2G2_FICCA|nr:hypothetical protein TIFTF001_033696 [Ficus carica]
MPSEIGNLFHLRYLGVGLKGAKLFNLPQSIGNLRNLHTLDLRNNEGIHFKTDEDFTLLLESPVVESGRLRSLAMVLPFDSAFPSLESLSRCHLLVKLVLKGKIQNDLHSSHHMQFMPPSLTKLVLSTSEIKQDGLVVLEKLQNLRFLQLGDYSYAESQMVFFSHEFVKLETLKLIELHEIQEWQVEKGTMPCLKRLDIYRIPKLRMIPDGLKFITFLRKIHVQMDSSFVDRIRFEDEFEGEDFYKVRHIPSVSISLVPVVW